VITQRVVPAAMASALLAVRACIAADSPALEVTRVADEPSVNPVTVERQSATESHLETVTVTGSLLPPTREDTASPLTVITLEDMQLRGLGSLSEALLQTSFATGSVENPQGSVNPGLLTVSLFGFSPSFVKYLVDGRPMADYPHLYGGRDMVVNLAGIPEQFIDRIEIVPGGESSLYGSDAIAGTVNVVLKKQLPGLVADFRYGAYDHGGGVSKRLALADSFSVGRLTVLLGAQGQRTDPIWGYQRALTASYYAAGTSPITAERDYVVVTYGATGENGYYFPDPTHCAAVSGQFGGTVQEHSRPGLGNYCGTTRAGFYTLDNGVRTAEGYLHATYDFGGGTQAYADVLYTHDYTQWSGGVGDMTYPQVINAPFFYDPKLGSFVVLQHLFSPEEAGGVGSTLGNLTSSVYRYSAGLTGELAHTGWTYDADISHAQYNLTRRNHVEFVQGLEQIFGPILGPNLGPDPIYGAFPTFTPDYIAFFRPLSSQQYAGVTGLTTSHGSNATDLVRAQLTNVSLAHLRGGDVGVAAVLEWGDESWGLNPDPRYADGEVYNLSAFTGGGRRSRMAGTSELRLPLLAAVELDVSARYDDYHVLNGHIGKPTYNLGLQIRPINSLMLRGRYGTAFKAPTLGDQFQGKTEFGTSVNDYYQCAVLGYSGPTLANCPYFQTPVGVVVAGNPALKPITADVWSAGIVWRPQTHTAVTADLLHWDLRNEVSFQSADQLMQLEAGCRLGRYDINSPSCVAALSQVTRDPTGVVNAIFTPKVNVSREVTEAFTMQIEEAMTLGAVGTLALQASWTDVLEHDYQQYPGDPVINELGDPTFSQDFKSKVNASLTWSIAEWNTTFYALRTGRSPNNLATKYGYGTPGAGTLAPWTVCNVNLRYLWKKSLGFSVTVDNLFDRMPPTDHTYTGLDNTPYNPQNYNVYGRAYYFQVTYDPRR
jgi:iron complex outermembrane receptor protein